MAGDTRHNGARDSAAGAPLDGAFRDAMSQLPSGLAAITAADEDGTPRALLVSSIASYSVSPPSLMVAIGRDSGSHGAITTRARFGVHVLAGDQEQLAHRFARPGVDKFSDVGWEWDGEVPRLVDALIYLPCSRRAVFPHGDHAVVVGEVLDVQRAAGDPLIYLRRRMDWQPGHCPEGPLTLAPQRRSG